MGLEHGFRIFPLLIMILLACQEDGYLCVVIYPDGVKSRLFPLTSLTCLGKDGPTYHGMASALALSQFHVGGSGSCHCDPTL